MAAIERGLLAPPGAGVSRSSIGNMSHFSPSRERPSDPAIRGPAPLGVSALGGPVDFSRLDEIPGEDGEGDDDAPDLSAILAPAPAIRSAAPKPAPDFFFGGTQDKFAALGADRLSAQAPTPPVGAAGPLAAESGAPAHGDLFADDPDEATRVADIGSALPLEAIGPRVAGWKVRSERGLVYELMTVDAVVAWLEGKPDLTSVQVARGEAAFRAVETYPELASRLGLRVRPTAKDAAPGASGLTLDTDRGSVGRSARPRQARGARPEVPAAAPQAAKEVGSPLGFRVVLSVLAGAVAAGSITLWLGLGIGWWEAPAVAPPKSAVEPPSPSLARAIAEYEAGRFTAAAELLRRLANKESDPRAWRYLALAYHRTNREREARSALANYRAGTLRATAQTEDDDGRQVRKVRD